MTKVALNVHAQNPFDRSKINDLKFIANLIFKVHNNCLVRAEHHEIVDVHSKSEQDSVYVLVVLKVACLGQCKTPAGKVMCG